MDNFYKVSKIKNGLKGEITIPADKSVSHRSLILGALTKGEIKIENFLTSDDCLSTLDIINNLGGVHKFLDENTLILNAKNCFKAPTKPLNCGNSGTTMRLISGLLASQNFVSTLYGDPSLSKRPMKRVISPLESMGAKIESNDFKSPLTITGGNLKSIEYESKISSAQVKSCLIIASLMSANKLTYFEPTLSRNHTELMLQYFGANITTEKLESKYKITLNPSTLTPKDVKIVGDISSAAFFIIMALIIPNSDIIIKNVGLNPTRTGILDVLSEMGANIKIFNEKTVSNEPIGDIQVKYTEKLKNIEIKGGIIPRLIDEIPAIALLLTQAEGMSVVKDAQELRNKESDRIKEIVTSLSLIGADIKETENGFVIVGKKPLEGGAKLKTNLDHRLAMTYFIAGLISNKPIEIENFACHKTSFPQFLSMFESLV